jgi:hypothetical protein
MPFKKLMAFMLSMVKQRSQNTLERVFPKLKEVTPVSPQAFSPVRQKVKGEAFPELFWARVRGSYNETLKDWRG